jgi:hypothetical protein
MNLQIKPTKALLIELKEILPRGSAAEIRNRLISAGKDFSLQYIYKVLDPDNTMYNEMIIDTAIELSEEIKLMMKQKEQRIKALRK